MPRTVIPELIAGDGSGVVPKIIHVVWVGSEPPEWVTDYWGRWEKVNPGWELKKWTDENSSQWPLSKILSRRLTSPTILADFIRVEMVWRHGGVYVDSDMQPLRPIDDLAGGNAWVETIVEGKSEPKINNGAFGFPEGHTALVDLWSYGIRNTHRKDPQRVIGPKVWREVLEGSDVIRLHHEAFSGLPWHKRRTILTYSQDQLMKAFPNNYAVHEYDHSWAPSAITVHPR